MRNASSSSIVNNVPLKHDRIETKNAIYDQSESRVTVIELEWDFIDVKTVAMNF